MLVYEKNVIEVTMICEPLDILIYALDVSGAYKALPHIFRTHFWFSKTLRITVIIISWLLKRFCWVLLKKNPFVRKQALAIALNTIITSRQASNKVKWEPRSSSKHEEEKKAAAEEKIIYLRAHTNTRPLILVADFYVLRPQVAFSHESVHTHHNSMLVPRERQ